LYNILEKENIFVHFKERGKVKKSKEVTRVPKDHFFFIEKNVFNLGYYEQTGGKGGEYYLIPPRPTEGREVTFVYKANGYIAKLHVTWLRKEGKWRDVSTDAGHGVIEDSYGTAKWHSHSCRRDEDFIEDMLLTAWLMKWRIDNLPSCPVCGWVMYLDRDRGVSFFRCDKEDRHPNQRPAFINDWAVGAPPELALFLEKIREATAKYHEENRRKGINPTPAQFTRKQWKKVKKTDIGKL